MDEEWVESVGEVVKAVLLRTGGSPLKQQVFCYLAHQHTAASVAQRRMCELMYISVNHLCGNTGASCS